jgi:hypothetical protein
MLVSALTKTTFGGTMQSCDFYFIMRTSELCEDDHVGVIEQYLIIEVNTKPSVVAAFNEYRILHEYLFNVSLSKYIVENAWEQDRKKYSSRLFDINAKLIDIQSGVVSQANLHIPTFFLNPNIWVLCYN